MAQRAWGRRLSGEANQTALEYGESISFDRRMYAQDIQGSVAHAEMLRHVGLLTTAEAGAIINGLRDIEREIEAGTFVFDINDEDIHMAIEAALIRKTDAGKKLHTGRSRNDQVAVDMRLWMRDEIQVLGTLITDLQTELVRLAERHVEDVMPALTHMQPAQPVSIAAYVLSFVEMLQRDLERLWNCQDRLNVCPLGSGAVAGSTLPLNRQMTSDLLGFSEPSRNSIDAVSDRDFCAEFIFGCSLILTHLSRLAEDWIIFAKEGTILLADADCTSSSMMPQKRNPDMLELTRGRVGRVYAALMGMLTVMKGQPSAYNRDNQEDKIHMFAATDATRSALGMVAGIVSRAGFNAARMAAKLDDGFLDSTALAEYLVSKGVPFREGHGIVAGLVRGCVESGLTKLRDLPLSAFLEACDKVDPDVYEVLNPEGVCQAYKTAGSGGIDSARAQIQYWKAELSIEDDSAAISE